MKSKRIILDDTYVHPPLYKPRGNRVLDGTYWDDRRISGYHKMLKAIIAPREPGKTTQMLNKCWSRACKKGETAVYLVRNSNIITPTFVENEIRQKIKKFFEVPVFEFSMTSAKAGNVDILAEGFPFMRIISLNMLTEKLKKVTVPHPSFIWMDEFVLDTKRGDRYLTSESSRFKDLYNTLVRENRGLYAYFTGNVYSRYNPYFLDWKVETDKLSTESIYTNDMCAVELVTLTEKLKKKIKAENPFYEFDDIYSKFALDGEAMNDRDVKVNRRFPRGFTLRFCVLCEGRKIGIFSNGYDYYVDYVRGTSTKDTLSFSIKELVNGTRIFTSEDKYTTFYFKQKMGRREVVFHDLSCYYLIEDIWNLL